jgi:hypothetical protein
MSFGVPVGLPAMYVPLVAWVLFKFKLWALVGAR